MKNIIIVVRQGIAQVSKYQAAPGQKDWLNSVWCVMNMEKCIKTNGGGRMVVD